MIARMLDLAKVEFNNGNMQAALGALGTIFAEGQPDREVLLLAASAHEKLGEKRRAAVRYAQALEMSDADWKEIATRSAHLFAEAGTPRDAVKVLTMALRYDDENADVLSAICSIQAELGGHAEAQPFASVLARLAKTYDHAMAAGMILNALGRFAEAAHPLKLAVQEKPDDRFALSEYFWCASNLADLTTAAVLQVKLEAAYKAEGAAADLRENAFRALMWTGDEELLARYARRTADVALPPVEPKPDQYDTNVDGKEPGIVRVGYVSCDFYDHATMALLAGILENHDRSRFEIFAFCHTDEDKRGDAMHERMLDTVDFYVDILEKNNDEVVELIRELGIDILVDLKGFTQGSRLGIFCKRPAPVQATWLGYPGSVTGAGIEFAITDEIVTPETSALFYQEKLKRLPVSYQCNDNRREQVARSGTRSEHGLPEDAIVFCSFNHAAKIRAPVFVAWMHILAAVEGSVLWLGQMSPKARENLQVAARSAGIAPERLIFAENLSVEDHLRRLPQADIALDTGPCNGHTTTSDALWAGVPVISFKGTSFAGRVSESLLTAVGLQALVADDLADFERLAIEIAKDGERREQLRAHLLAARDEAPLFDTKAKTRQLEAVFEEMLTEVAGEK